MELNKDYINTFEALYRLNTSDNGKIEELFQRIKIHLIETKLFTPTEIIKSIKYAAQFNIRYIGSYMILLKIFLQEYPKTYDSLIILFQHILIGKIPIESAYVELVFDYHYNHYASDKNGEIFIVKMIMNDDIKAFVSFIESEYAENDYKLNLASYRFYQYCCYYGAVNCFRFLRTKLKCKNDLSGFPRECLNYSFIGGNPDIISECLKWYKPNNVCMSYAIATHNIDFVTFLMNEYNLIIEIADCMIYNNLQAFLVYLDKLNDINKCVAESVHFNIMSLCEFFILHGADINGKGEEGSSAFIIAAKENKLNFVNLLISHGADVNFKNGYGTTALHYAIQNNNINMVETLISHGADVNAKNSYGQTPFEYSNDEIIMNFLKSHGAKSNLKIK